MTSKDRAYIGFFGTVLAIQGFIEVVYLGWILDALKQLAGA